MLHWLILLLASRVTASDMVSVLSRAELDEVVGNVARADINSAQQGAPSTKK